MKTRPEQGYQLDRVPVLAAGGIVLRRQPTPLIAVVRLRKRDEWVLPKGKLDPGETPRAAAEREVWEETGHTVSVHEFLGTLVCETANRSKIVHYWRMEASGQPSRELTNDVRAVDWLPLDAALERLSRNHERAFLAQVGPLAIEAAQAAGRVRRAAPAKRRSRQLEVTEAVRKMAAPALLANPPDAVSAPPRQSSAPHQPLFEQCEVVAADASIAPMAFDAVIDGAEAVVPPPEVEEVDAHHDGARSNRGGNLMQKLRGWLRGAP